MAQQNLDELIAALTTLTTALTKIKATDVAEEWQSDYVKLPQPESLAIEAERRAAEAAKAAEAINAKIAAGYNQAVRGDLLNGDSYFYDRQSQGLGLGHQNSNVAIQAQTNRLDQGTKDFLDEGFGSTDQYPHILTHVNVLKSKQTSCNQEAWPYRVKYYAAIEEKQLAKFINDETEKGDELVAVSAGTFFIFKNRTTKR